MCGLRNTNGVLNGSKRRVLWYVLKLTIQAVHVMILVQRVLYSNGYCNCVASGSLQCQLRVQNSRDKGEVFGMSVVTVMAVEEAMVKGVAEGKGHPVPGDVGAPTRAISVVTC